MAHLAETDASPYELALADAELDVAASRTRDREQRCGVEAFRHLVKARNALDDSLFEFATRMKVVGSQLDTALAKQPLRNLLQDADWTDASLEKAWCSDTHFASLLPIPALVSPDVLMPHLPALIKD